MLFYVLLIICLVLVFVFRKKDADYWKKRNITQVDGTVWKFFQGNRSLPEYFKDIYDTYDTHVGAFLGSKPALVLKDLEDVQAVFTGDFQSFTSRGIVTNPNDTLADNILFMDDFKRWKCIRQKLSPVFTSLKLKNMFYIMDKCAKDFVEMLDESKKMRDDPFNALYTYTTASIAASVFGIDAKSKSTMDSPFLEMSRKTLEPTFKNKLLFFISSEFPRLFRWLNLKTFAEHEDFFIGAVKNVLECRKNDTIKRHDFIEICLELQKQGTIKDPSTGYELEPTVELLAAQAFFFFLAGVDTSANSMHFTLLQLAGEQIVLTKVHEEVDSVFLNCGEELTYNDVEKLQYLDMVISESMRMYPNIGSIQRKCTKDTILPGSKVRIDKGTLVIIPVYGIQRDEKYHPEPDLFNPERFAPENLSMIKRFSYLPFGEGNRICIGSRFARLQLKAGMAWLLRRYTLAEKKYAPKHFQQSSFSLRDATAAYTLIRRNV